MTTDAARMRQSLGRDETARLRDLAATARDMAAEERDRAASRQAKAAPDVTPSDDPALEAVRAASSAVRGQAAADRIRAAGDRQRSAADREHSAVDRRHTRTELERSHLDGLTGAYSRELGRVSLQHEIDRAHRSGEPFVLGSINVDGLAQINDREGHAAGDALLRDVVVRLKSRLRSYDPVVRVSGDEFLCGFTNTPIEVAQVRAAELSAAGKRSASVASINIGLASLNQGEVLDELIARARAGTPE